jgi:hypothetical protein
LFSNAGRRRNQNNDRTANRPSFTSTSAKTDDRNEVQLRNDLLQALLSKKKDTKPQFSKDPLIKTSVSVSSSTSSSSSKEVVKGSRRKKGKRKNAGKRKGAGKRKNAGSQIDTRIKNLTPQERLVKKVQETLNTRDKTSNQATQSNNARPKPSTINNENVEPKRPRFRPKGTRQSLNKKETKLPRREESASSNRDALKRLFQISKTPTQSEQKKVKEQPQTEKIDIRSLVSENNQKTSKRKLILRKKKPNGRSGRQLFDGNSRTKKIRLVKKVAKQDFRHFPTQ